MLPCRLASLAEVGESHPAVVGTRGAGLEKERERARSASGVPQARPVGVFLTAKGPSQAGHPLAISCLIPFVMASNNAIDEKPRNRTGEVGITASSARPGCCHCRHLLPPVRLASAARSHRRTELFTGPATWVRGALPSFPGSIPVPMRSQTGSLASTAATNHVRKRELAPEFKLPIGHVWRCLEDGKRRQAQTPSHEKAVLLCAEQR